MNATDRKILYTLAVRAAKDPSDRTGYDLFSACITLWGDAFESAAYEITLNGSLTNGEQTTALKAFAAVCSLAGSFHLHRNYALIGRAALRATALLIIEENLSITEFLQQNIAAGAVPPALPGKLEEYVRRVEEEINGQIAPNKSLC